MIVTLEIEIPIAEKPGWQVTLWRAAEIDAIVPVGSTILVLCPENWDGPLWTTVDGYTVGVAGRIHCRVSSDDSLDDDMISELVEFGYSRIEPGSVFANKGG